MSRFIVRHVAALAGVMCVVPLAWAASRRAVDFPDGYRRWTHVSTTFIGPDAPPAAMSERGVHHVYANEQAIEGLLTGRYPDGARFAYDLLATTTQNGVIKVTRERLRLDVMEKNAARFAETGGWGFESFVNGDRTRPRVADRGATMCWQCHQNRTTQGVFSVYVE